MESPTEEGWESVTWEGNRRAQLRQALRLTLRERLQAVEDMCELSERFAEMRRRRTSANETEEKPKPESPR